MRMRNFHNYLVRHATSIIISGLVVLVAAGVFGVGLFEKLNDGNENFFATGTASAQANQKLKDIFGTGKDASSVVLFEAKASDANVRTADYATEVARILEKLSTQTVVSYYTTGLDQFVSRDGRATYAVVTLEGSKDEQYQKLMEFSDAVSSDIFTVSIGGTMVGTHQTTSQAKEDLTRAELISLPILALLLLWFFRSPIAAAVPLLMSICTIAGGLALTRLLSYVLAIDTYSLNVITILGVGLSVDYSLLTVNRFREELDAGSTPREAALRTMRTAGRTVFFSGMTVIVCLLSLLFLPVGFMQSVSIGGATAVAAAVIVSTLLLPLALMRLGHGINTWSLRRRTSVKGWTKLAHLSTKFPVIALTLGVCIIAGIVWPIHAFQTKTFDWHVLPSNQSAYHVGKVISEQFDQKTATLTVLAEFTTDPTPAQLCLLASTVGNVEGVDSIQAAYAPNEQLSDCEKVAYALTVPAYAGQFKEAAANQTSGRYARVDIVPTYDASDVRIRDLVKQLKTANYGEGVHVSVTGTAALARDTLDAYIYWLPYVIGTIVIAMVVILSLLLGSIVLPLQAVVINSLALFISLGVLVMIFQFGWGADILNMTPSGGFELSIPILVFVAAFGLSMDYAVFLYSRMHEVYDQTGDPTRAIVDGVVKTGPIITAAALLLFVVVASFATSRISLMQQVGVGLATAVLVDAFFVRIFFVPAVMKLFGRVSWWGPKWLKDRTITHD